MSIPAAGEPGGPPLYAATLVATVALSAIDALAVIALVLDRPVQGVGTARRHVLLDGGAWAEVEIPKFGEPPPLAVDVYSTRDDAHARAEALDLAARLREVAGWRIHPDFPTP